MKLNMLILGTLSACGALMAQTSILVDFGKPTLESSAATDPNGHHWNNISPEPGATNGVLGWELLTTEQKAAYTNPGDHYLVPGILPYVAVADAVDKAGASTGVSITLSEIIDVATYTSAGGFGMAGLEFSDDFGAIPTQTGYPSSATIDSFYINWGFEAVFSVSGLDDARTYTLKMWGGQARDSRPVAFIVNDDIDGKQVIETLNNTGSSASNYALFENVAPVGGAIRIKCLQGVDPATQGAINGQWSTLEIIGDFSGVQDWYGYQVDAAGWADTGAWMGLVNVTWDPWIWVLDLNQYVYAAADTGWVYIPR